MAINLSQRHYELNCPLFYNCLVIIDFYRMLCAYSNVQDKEKDEKN